MVSFKYEVPSYKRSDGTYGLVIRIIHKRAKRRIPTHIRLSQEDVTRGGLKLKNYKHIDFAESLIKEYRDKCNAVNTDAMTIDEVVEYLTSNTSEEFRLDFIQYGRKLAEKMTNNGKGGTAAKYVIAINSFVRFIGRDSIDVSEISSSMLSEWRDWIGETYDRKKGTKGLAAQNRYLCCLRAMYNKAKNEFNDEERGKIPIPYSPFKKVEIPKPELSKPRALTVEQIRMIAQMDYIEEIPDRIRRFNIAKDVFMLSFYLLGMNSVDLFEATDYHNGRITYNRAKTKDRRADNAEISVLVPDEALPLVDKWRDPTGQRVFCFYRYYSTMYTFTTCLNAGLKDIGEIIGEEKLQFYAARHSWATIATNDAKVDKYTVHSALNHSDPTMRVTDIYIKKDWSNIDEANRKVLDIVFG